jgi:hypothetical protein
MAKKDKNIHDKDSVFSDIAGKFKANPALYIGSVVILVLVVVTFVGGDFLSGGRRYAGNSGDITFGYYDKVPISLVSGNKLYQYYEQLVRRYRDQIDLSNFQIAMELWSQSYKAAVVHIAILRETRRSNYEPPENFVNKEVAKLPEFQDENGRFSLALYRQMPDTKRLALWRQVREELAVIQFYNDLFGLLISDGEKEFMANMDSGMRTFEMVSFLVDDFPDSECLTYAHENPDLFKSIHLSRFTVKSGERAAKKIIESIKDGTTTFEEAAKAQSQDSFADKGGDMGIQYVYDIKTEITDEEARGALLNLGKGELSSVIKIGENWVFFRVEDELKPANFDDDAVIDVVRSYMRNYERGRMEDWAIARADEFIADVKENGLNVALGRRRKEKSSVGPLAINYGSVDLFTSLEKFSVPGLSGKELSDLSKNANFWKTAFSAPLNTPAEPLVQGNKVLVFLPVEQTDIDEEKAKELSSKYSDYWLGSTTERSLQPYFMNSPKMEDHFWETYRKFFL